MSEETFYEATVESSLASQEVTSALRDRGVRIRDAAAWESAAERVVALKEACAKELSAQGPKLAANPEISRLSAMIGGFSSVPLLNDYAMAVYGSEFSSLSSKASRLFAIPPAEFATPGATLEARSARESLTELATRVQKDLCAVETRALTRAMGKSMSDLGYLVEAKGTALRATMGPTCVWIKADDFGSVKMDMSGFSGLSCVKELSRIEETFSRQGIKLSRKNAHRHQKPEGGVLANSLEPIFPVFRAVPSTGKCGQATNQNATAVKIFE